MKPAKKADIQEQRSQRVVKLEFDKLKESANLEKLIRAEETRLKAAEGNRDRQARLVCGGQFIFERNLQDSVNEIALRKAKLTSLENYVGEVRREIDGLRLTTAQARERAKKKAELGRLAGRRFDHDALIDAAIEQVRGLLDGRHKLTAQMIGLAKELDFSGDNFDGARFDDLLRLLPKTVQTESRSWLAYFLGQANDRRLFVITHELEIFPETLDSCMVFRRGERALLTEDQRKIAAYDPPAALGPVEMQRLMAAQGKTEPEATGKIQWGILRG